MRHGVRIKAARADAMAYQPGIDRAGLKRHGNASRGRFPEAACRGRHAPRSHRPGRRRDVRRRPGGHPCLRRHADAVVLVRAALAYGLAAAIGWLLAGRSGPLGSSDPIPAWALVAAAGL
ncbi:hypothetical protein ACLBXO_26135 [Methylobacterium sp. C33D]